MHIRNAAIAVGERTAAISGIFDPHRSQRRVSTANARRSRPFHAMRRAGLSRGLPYGQAASSAGPFPSWAAGLFPADLPATKDDRSAEVSGVALDALLPKGSPVYRYDGSVTAASNARGSFERLSTQFVSTESIDRFRELFEDGNPRALKAVGDRSIHGPVHSGLRHGHGRSRGQASLLEESGSSPGSGSEGPVSRKGSGAFCVGSARTGKRTPIPADPRTAARPQPRSAENVC